jgi:hypothetical protein
MWPVEKMVNIEAGICCNLDLNTIDIQEALNRSRADIDRVSIAYQQRFGATAANPS